MRLGIASSLKHDNPRQWAQQLKNLGCSSIVFPVDYTADEALILEYVKEAKDKDLIIAEVGVWCNPIAKDENEREAAISRCVEQLKLADRIGAKCCVNITGSVGERWDGAYKENFSEETWRKTVASIQEIIDRANPQSTYYTIEPMPWMIPYDPDQYLRLIKEVNREHFAVHMDLANWITSPDKYFFNEDFIIEIFDKLGSYIKSCHMKDVHLKEEFTFQLQEIACGDGNLNLELYASLATKVNPDMPMLIEHLNTDEEYYESFHYVKARMETANIPIK